ncbi:MAG: branched-chain amino acid ABC transporter permease [Candidatus Hydrothermarchaeota archaeon]
MSFDAGILFQVVFWGLYAGCIYILLATGLTIIFGVMKIVNFAHGELLMLGSYVTFWAVTLLGINPYLAMIFSMITLGILGIGIERLCFRPILGTGKLNEIFLSLGLIFFFQNLAAKLWGADFRSIHSPYESILIPIGSANLPFDYLVIMIVTSFILLILHIFLKKTSIGRAIRATSQNRKAAMLMGINVERVDMLTFGLGSALAAAAGSLWVVGGLSFNPYMGTTPAIKAFAVIILGGLGSIPGAIAGGLTLGLAENIAAYLGGGAWKDATSFAILIAVLVIRPTGIFGEREE